MGGPTYLLLWPALGHIEAGAVATKRPVQVPEGARQVREASIHKPLHGWSLTCMLCACLVLVLTRVPVAGTGIC